jgi:hypothetical protein
MNKIIKIVIGLIVILAIFACGYEIPFIFQPKLPSQTDISQLKPIKPGEQSYIKNGILYTSVATIPVACITQIEKVTDTVNFMLIEYKLSATHSGIIAMSCTEYNRLFPEE